MIGAEIAKFTNTIRKAESEKLKQRAYRIEQRVRKKDKGKRQN
jgi:hypothetical protein